MKSIEEYNPKNISHKFNLFEKNNFLTNLFLQLTKSSGWTDVIYSDKDVVVVFNEETKSLIGVLVGTMNITEFDKLQCLEEYSIALCPTTFASSKNIEYKNLWGTPVDEETYLTTEIFFHIQLREITKNLKIPQMWEVYNHILISVFKKINQLKIAKKEYENNCINFSDLKVLVNITGHQLKNEVDYIINKTHNYE